MKVLIIGSGGREHVLTWTIKQSPKVTKIYCAPGNGGMADIAECVEIKAEDIPGLLKFAEEKAIDLTVVGPEAPLAAGIVDEFEKAGLKVFGPNKAAAQLEGSKVFAKEFMKRHGIPTAGFQVFDNKEAAAKFLDALKKDDFPVVIKAEGLAAGKGVLICRNIEEAGVAVAQIMAEKVFKSAGDRIVIEEFLEGEEASILAISDGKNFVMLDSSQDHKRIFDNDEGPNTGGMGAYSPAPVVTPELFQTIAQQVIKPTIDGMRKDGTPFKGVLYAGLMLTADGPKVLEYNVRFGDPEAQAVLPRLKTDLLDVMLAACDGKLAGTVLEWDPRSCVCVVMASGGYPGDYEKGKEIFGLDAVKERKDAVVFHAGTQLEGGKIVTSGGRVLGVTSLGATIEEAIRKAYQAVAKIKFEKCFYRRDIGHRAWKKIGV
jgi:phosphoribosylamine--glycine ligase